MVVWFLVRGMGFAVEKISLWANSVKKQIIKGGVKRVGVYLL